MSQSTATADDRQPPHHQQQQQQQQHQQTETVSIENGNGGAGTNQSQSKSELEDKSQPKQITDTTTSTTAWGQYLNSLNTKYQDKIKEAAQKPKYSLTIRNANGQDESLTFTRMKLLQYQFDEIEDLRAESTEATENKKPKEAGKLMREMYAKAATYILWNVREKRPMTLEEYKMAAFSEVRPALDASILLGLISDPN
jgi:hypothetical protein